MQRYWDERARLNGAWYVDTSLDFDAPDMHQFFASGERIVAHALAQVPTTPGTDRVALEIGCGLGRLCRALAKAPFGHVIGVDISPEMVQQARRLVPECDFRVNDGSTLDGIADASVDFVLTFTVFQHIPVPDVVHGYVSEIGRVLKPGGSAYIQWNGSEKSLGWTLRRTLSGMRYRAGLGGDRRGTDAPEFQGSRIEPDVMRRWLGDSGLVVGALDARGGLWTQASVVKSGPGA